MQKKFIVTYKERVSTNWYDSLASKYGKELDAKFKIGKVIQMKLTGS